MNSCRREMKLVLVPAGWESSLAHHPAGKREKLGGDYRAQNWSNPYGQKWLLQVLSYHITLGSTPGKIRAEGA